MTQVSAMLSTGAPLVDTSAIESSPLRLFLIIGVAVWVLSMIGVIIFNRRKKNKISSVSFFIGILIPFILAMTGFVTHMNSYEESEKASNTKIAQFIQEKYGVTVLNDQNIGSDIGEHSNLTPLSIPAKDPNGARIQITIELSEDGTDVLAFSSGAEMKKVNEETSNP